MENFTYKGIDVSIQEELGFYSFRLTKSKEGGIMGIYTELFHTSVQNARKAARRWIDLNLSK